MCRLTPPPPPPEPLTFEEWVDSLPAEQFALVTTTAAGMELTLEELFEKMHEDV